MFKRAQKIVNGIYGCLATKWFFYTATGLFVFHASWLALSSRLLPYDEYYHVGIIKYYANQWSPFISSQPSEVSYLGDITRLPSYLYHYLMSFPYRFISLFTQNEEVITIILRFMNIGLFLAGTIIFRKLFFKAGFSKRLVNIVTAIFLLTPFTVMLAAQNNYDNLVYLLIAVLFWLAYKIISSNKLNAIDLLLFASVGLLGCVVKNSFIVVFAALTFSVLIMLVKRRSNVFKQIKSSVTKSSKITLILSAILFFIAAGLFTERHVVNVVSNGGYNTRCADVQPFEVCYQYSPWQRGYKIRQNPPATERYGNPLSFAQHWVATNMAGLYPIFANVPQNADPENLYGNYDFRPRLAVLLAVAYIVLVVGSVAIITNLKNIWKSDLLKMSAIASLTLAITLLIFNYNTYLNQGKAYAVQVRYLLPVMFPVMLIFAYALNQQFTKFKYKQLIAVIVLAVYLLWGGVVGWIIRSDTSWWLDNQTVISVNQTAQGVLENIVPN